MFYPERVREPYFIQLRINRGKIYRGVTLKWWGKEKARAMETFRVIKALDNEHLCCSMIEWGVKYLSVSNLFYPLINLQREKGQGYLFKQYPRNYDVIT